MPPPPHEEGNEGKAPKADDKPVDKAIAPVAEGRASIPIEAKSDAPLAWVKRDISTMATDQPISQSQKQRVKSIKVYLDIFSEMCVIV